MGWLGVIWRKAVARQWRAHPNDHMLSRWIVLTFAPAIPPRLSAVSIPLHLLFIIFSRLYSSISVSSCDAHHFYWTRMSTTLYSSNVVFTIRPSTNYPRFMSINTRFTSFNPRFIDSYRYNSRFLDTRLSSVGHRLASLGPRFTSFNSQLNDA